MSDMKLTHLAVQLCMNTRLEVINKEKIISLFQKCSTIKGIQLNICSYLRSCLGYSKCSPSSNVYSYYPSLEYCYLECRGRCRTNHTFVLEVINSCKQLKCVTVDVVFGKSLNPAQNDNLQQLCITLCYIYYCDNFVDVFDIFMSSVSAHGGLICVYLLVNSLSTEGITTLVRNSPKLCKLYVKANYLYDVNGQNLNKDDVQDFSATLKKKFSYRKLFNAGYYEICTSGFPPPPPDDLSPLWN